MKEAYAIEMENVSKRFGGVCALDNVTLKVRRGEIHALVGENGAGKSTTINLIMNSLKKDSGEISVMGVDNASGDFAELKEDIGVVLDEAYFPMVINAEVVNKMMKATYTRWDEEVFFGYIHRFDLPQKKPFKEFSRGMKMKLAIAVALSHDPKLLVLDEATSGLDPIVRDEILEIFYDFTRDPEHSVLISSHILSDLEKLCCSVREKTNCWRNTVSSGVPEASWQIFRRERSKASELVTMALSAWSKETWFQTPLTLKRQALKT